MLNRLLRAIADAIVAPVGSAQIVTIKCPVSGDLHTCLVVDGIARDEGSITPTGRLIYGEVDDR